MQAIRNIAITKLDDEFNKPVESIMRCEDFKSNFARRLSNRFIPKTSVSLQKQTSASNQKQATESKLRVSDGDAGKILDTSYGVVSTDPDQEISRRQVTPDLVNNQYKIAAETKSTCLIENEGQSPLVHKLDSQTLQSQEIITQSIQLGQNIEEEQNGEPVKPPDKPPMMDADIKRTQATARNLEVDTLRWQLAQTEANRQMHIALLKQIVAFLNRVKDHIQTQNSETSPQNDTKTTRLFPKSFNMADLPRSRSVVHVNKNVEYSLATPKRMSTRKISKSISNVNGFKEYDIMRSQSKLLIEPEKETSRKISEEISRLITLANTVLSTKIPDLACNDTESNFTKTLKPNAIFKNVITSNHNSTTTLNLNEEDREIFFKEEGEVFVDGKESIGEKLILSSTLENDFLKTKSDEKTQIITTEERSDLVSAKIKTINEKKSDFNYFFIEDESGFSSMSSFQEIGIPIISIIPPSPCEEIVLMEEIPDIIDDVEKWKTDSIELEKQSMKVFWV